MESELLSLISEDGKGGSFPRSDLILVHYSAESGNKYTLLLIFSNNTTRDVEFISPPDGVDCASLLPINML